MADPRAWRFEKLRGRENYHTWKTAMWAELVKEDLWNVVKYGLKEGDANDADDQAMAHIIGGVIPEIFVHINPMNKTCTTAKAMWAKLAEKFAGSGLAMKVQLMSELVNTRLGDCKSNEEYVSKIATVVQKLSAIEFELTEDWVCTFMLAGLPAEYEPMIMAVKSSGVKLERDAIERMIIRKDVPRVSQRDEALLARPSSGRDRKFDGKCYNCDQRGHLAKFCRATMGKVDQRTGDKANIVCYSCKKTGHYASECGKSEKPGNAFLTSVVTTANVVSSASNEIDWLVDSGASVHMCREDVGVPSPGGGAQWVHGAGGQRMSVLGVVRVRGEVEVDDTGNRVDFEACVDRDGQRCAVQWRELQHNPERKSSGSSEARGQQLCVKDPPR